MAVVIMAQKHMKKHVVFSYIHKVSSNKMCKIYYIYTHSHTYIHTHTWAPGGKLENLHNKILGSFITEVPVTVLMKMFIIFLILNQISIYH